MSFVLLSLSVVSMEASTSETPSSKKTETTTPDVYQTAQRLAIAQNNTETFPHPAYLFPVQFHRELYDRNGQNQPRKPVFFAIRADRSE